MARKDYETRKGVVPLERYNEKRLSKEYETIEKISKHKERMIPIKNPELTSVDIIDAEKVANRYEDAAPPGIINRSEDCIVYDVEWPGYYGIAPSDVIPTEVINLTKRYPASNVLVYVACDAAITLKEVVSYVHEVQPESFSWGMPCAILVGGKVVSTAYHATRMNVPTTLLYKVYTSMVTIESPAMTPAKIRAEYVVNIANSTNSDTNNIDTAGRLMLETYQPGYLLDTTTLIAVLARRTACISRLNSYAETQSYPMFDKWVAEAAEINNEQAFAYTVGILGNNPQESLTILETCEENGSDCLGILSDLLYKNRMEHWY